MGTLFIAFRGKWINGAIRQHITRIARATTNFHACTNTRSACQKWVRPPAGAERVNGAMFSTKHPLLHFSKLSAYQSNKSQIFNLRTESYKAKIILQFV